MLQCGYCGKAYPDGTTQCPVDGEILRPLESTAANPTQAPASEEGANGPFGGVFQLREIGAQSPKRQRTLAGSKSGFTVGLMSIAGQELVLEKRLSISGGLSLAIAGFILVALGIAFVMLCTYGPGLTGAKSPGGFLLLPWLGVLGGPLLGAVLIRRYQRRLSLADVIQAEVRGVTVVLQMRSNAAQGPPMLQLDFQLRHPASLPRLQRALAAAGVELKDPMAAEKASFVEGLKLATPTAWVTPTLIWLNIVIFLMLAVDSKTISAPALPKMLQWGADFGPLTVTDGQWWRLLTCCFVHLGIMHLICNMYALRMVGKLTEQFLGNWYFLLIYLGCGLAGSLTSLWFNPALVSVGASGAIFGVFGALLGYIWREGPALPRSQIVPVRNGAMVFIGWNLVSGLSNWLTHSASETISSLNHTTNTAPLIDIGAHAGGLIAGLLFGYLGARPLEAGKRKSLTTRRALFLAAGLCLTLGLLCIPVLQANSSSVERDTLLGKLYYNGEGVGRNAYKAAAWFRKAADDGDLDSQVFLAKLYYRGDGVEKDKAEAVQWFSKAAEQNDLVSEKMLAALYSLGDGVPVNKPEALKWLTKVADQGDLDSQKSLCSIYAKGDGVDKDMAEAIMWAGKAGEQGDLPCQKMLAIAYYKGEEVKTNKYESARWFKMAANQGDALSEKMIGLMYAGGDGIAKSPVEASKWLTICGDKSAIVEKVRQNLDLELTADQKQEVTFAVRRFIKAHPNKLPQTFGSPRPTGVAPPLN